MLELLRQKDKPKNGVRENKSAKDLGCPQKQKSTFVEPAALFSLSLPMLARESKVYMVCPEGRYLLLAKHGLHLYLVEQDSSYQLLLLVNHM